MFMSYVSFREGRPFHLGVIRALILTKPIHAVTGHIPKPQIGLVELSVITSQHAITATQQSSSTRADATFPEMV